MARYPRITHNPMPVPEGGWAEPWKLVATRRQDGQRQWKRLGADGKRYKGPLIDIPSRAPLPAQ